MGSVCLERFNKTSQNTEDANNHIPADELTTEQQLCRKLEDEKVLGEQEQKQLRKREESRKEVEQLQAELTQTKEELQKTEQKLTKLKEEIERK